MKVLAVSPHADDVEFGAGATIARLVREGHQVHNHIFFRFDIPGLDEECQAAAKVLGVTVSNGDIALRSFPQHRKKVLDGLILLRQTFAPDLVLCPARSDRHQDHEVVSAECGRAFRHVTTLGYVLPWNCPSVATTAWKSVTEEDVEKKQAAVACYRSQKDKQYASKEAVRSGLVLGGIQAGVPLAEAFEVVRWVS